MFNIGAPYFEACFWVAALIGLACTNPGQESHFSLCFFKRMGWSLCPGCGLGHSIAWLFHGNMLQSFKAHPLGLFALAVILHRIYILIKTRLHQFTIFKTNQCNQQLTAAASTQHL
ncbi:MAG: DUF2752 domain-containing protein [Sphingobacteriales bacterium]|nr:MAG: DUF2752 domain-containing protein [Sphingobacteriales bacterium]